MSEQIFKALIKNDNDEALSEFKSAIQQKFDTAMNVRRIGLTSEIFNGEKPVPVTEEVKLEEGKSSTGYELYHKSFSAAMQHAYDFAKKKFGIIVDPKEIDDKVAAGPRKPSKGKTNSYRLKGDKGAIQVQVYGMDSGKYELNMYKEEVELDEAKEVTPKDVEDHLVKTGVNPKDAKDAVKKGFDYANKKYGGSTHKAAVKKIAEVVWSLHEEVELEEAVSADKFVKGGDDKIKQSEVDMLLGKIYDDSKLTKALISSKAYGDGESNPKKKNPYKKDTIDFHLYQLGQQVELSRR
jgi:hypothetical protein